MFPTTPTLVYLLLCWLQLATSVPFSHTSRSLLDISISDLGALLGNGTITSYGLVDLYMRRTKEVNDDLNAVIELNPHALNTARQLDEERAKGSIRGPLHGIPILVKDNYATDDMPTGAGSVCLARSRPRRDAHVVSRLRKAGAIILGKANLSEFSGMRGSNVTEGWSARGGQTSGAYVKHQSACGSSSGSGVAASLGLAAGTLGTETSGSISCPAMFNNVVGIKPTVGLTSRDGVVPLTPRQDTTGPIAQSVADAAAILDIIAGKDVNDNYTSAQPWDAPPSYTSALNASALVGKRLGVIWLDDDILNITGGANREQTKVVFDKALLDLEAAGAELVNVTLGTRGVSLQEAAQWVRGNMSEYAFPDFKEGMSTYIGDLLPGPDGIANISELYECLKSDPLEQASTFSLENWELALQVNITAGSAKAWEAYVAASGISRNLIVDPIVEHKLDAIVMPPELSWTATASPGLPIVTVPIGALGDDAETVWGDSGTLIRSAPGLPLGLSFTADRWTEKELIGYAYAYEQVSRKRRTLKPQIKPSSDLDSILKYNMLELL
ncbi:amidase signature domain-containing protein [Whalleya microplaca]|nr:amidase signature domain-containing protein [Whalleya microplaca]